MINVQHRALRALKQHGVALVQRLIQILGSIGNKWTNRLRLPQRFVASSPAVSSSTPYAARQSRIFFRDHALKLCAKYFRVHQIAHAQPVPRHLVFVGRANAARRGADFSVATRGFRGFVHLPVIRKNQVRAIADVQSAGNVESSFRKHFHFRDQRGRIHHTCRRR